MNTWSVKTHNFVILIMFGLILSSCASNNGVNNKDHLTPTQYNLAQNILPNTATPTLTPIPEVSIGTVLVKSLNIRSGPGTGFGVIGSMKQGDTFQILADIQNLDANQKWLLIPLTNNSFGWVIGEPNYVTEKLIIVDSMTYLTWVYNTRRAKMIYDATPTSVNKLKLVPTNSTNIIPSSVCTCSYNAYDCSDFSTQKEAQSCFDYCNETVGYDVHWLDGDGDGYVCEWIP